MVVTMSKGFRFMKNSWVTTMVKDQGADKVRGKVGDVGVIGRRRGGGSRASPPTAGGPGTRGAGVDTSDEGRGGSWVRVRGSLETVAKG